jgi:uncharacterized protein (DUF58 family)
VSRKARLALLLGVATYVGAWAFGSLVLYPVATGVVLAVGLAWTSVRLAAGPMTLRRDSGGREYFEGDDVPVRLELEASGRAALTSVTLVEWIVKLGRRRTPLRWRGGRLRGGYVLKTLPRGRYVLAAMQVELEDPFGLERLNVPLRAGGALVVYPRLVEVERLFSESGAQAQDGRRLLLRRPSGFDLHSVREYQEGESLRRVHWRSTARRGRLMVKELEDAPRDEVAVLLDADASAVVGDPPESSFDLQVRAAGSILLAHARRGRRAVLLVNSGLREVQRVHSLDGDWGLALEVLAAAEPTGQTQAANLLADDSSPAARALELTIVTARMTPELVDRLIQRVLERRSVSLVYVDAASFNGVGPRPEPILLRLQSAGVPIAVCRRGDDLARSLGATPLAEAAGG